MLTCRQVKEAVRIRRRGGMGQILNSKGEFSRCYIPRLVIEEEDKEAKEERLSMEKQERDLVTKLLDEDDDEWEKRKQRDRELRDKKRGRGTCNGEDETPILDLGRKGRENCFTCREKRGVCMKAGIVYKITCVTCS